MGKINKDKIKELKGYSEINLYHQLSSACESLPDDFITDNLWTKSLLKEKVNRIINCSTRNILHKSENKVLTIDKTTGEIKGERREKDSVNLYFGNSCDTSLICPVCARKRSDIIKAKYTDTIKEHTELYNYAYTITFTIDNKKTFNEAYDLLQSSLRNFRLKGQKRKNGRSLGESGKIKSSIGMIEVKTGKNSGLWHVHAHVLVFTDEKLDYKIYDQDKKAEIINDYIRSYGRKPEKEELKGAWLKTINFQGEDVPVSKLSYEWYLSSGKTSTNIKVIPQKVEETENGPELVYYRKVDNNRVKTYTRHEVIKYSAKINELETDKLIELIINKEKKRFLFVWGAMRSKLNNDEINELGVNEERIKIDYLDVLIYNSVKGDYDDSDLNSRDQSIVNELVEKKERLSLYRGLSNQVRSVHNKIKEEFRNKLIIHGMSNSKVNLDVIKSVDSLRKALRVYNECLFRVVVNIKKLRNRKLDQKYLTKLQKYYYNMIDDKLNFLGKIEKCNKQNVTSVKRSKANWLEMVEISKNYSSCKMKQMKKSKDC